LQARVPSTRVRFATTNSRAEEGLAQPVIVQEPSLHPFSAALVRVFRLPPWKYFVTVLVGLLHCDDSRTLSGVLRQVAWAMTLSGLSRFLSEAPWSVAALTCARQRRCNQQVAEAVDQGRPSNAPSVSYVQVGQPEPS